MTDSFKASILIHASYCEIVPAYNDREVVAFTNLFEVLEYVGKERIQITLVEYAQPDKKQEADLIASRIVGYHVTVGATGSTSEAPRRLEFTDAQAKPRFTYEREVRYDPIRKHAVIVVRRAKVVAAMYVSGETRYTEAHNDNWAKEVSKEDVGKIDDRLHLLAENAELRLKISKLEAERRRIATLEASLVEAELEANPGK